MAGQSLTLEERVAVLEAQHKVMSSDITDILADLATVTKNIRRLVKLAISLVPILTALAQALINLLLQG